MSCQICPRHCNIDRDTSAGYCRTGNTPIVAKVMRHMWEEPIISGDRGSGIVFFSGCNMKCIFCQNEEISHHIKGKPYTPKALADLFKMIEDSGVSNINLATPTHFVDGIIRALDIYKPNIPIVYNTGTYESIETLRRLEGYIDIYLPDLKYSDNALAIQLSKANGYFDIATRAILEMYRQQPRDIIENGLMKKGVIVRHLVLPQCIENSRGVAQWLIDNIPHDKYISIMSQFTPHGDLEGAEFLTRRLKPLEYRIIVNMLDCFDNAYIQEFSSSNEEFIPDFDKEIEL